MTAGVADDGQPGTPGRVEDFTVEWAGGRHEGLDGEQRD